MSLPCQAQHEATARCCNCNALLQGPFCSQCGQKDKAPVRSVFAMASDFLGEVGHWDSRLYRTLKYLFIRPGFLSLEYVRGRHADYVPPLRMYFFISLIAFMVISSLLDYSLTANNHDVIETQGVSSQEVNFDGFGFLSEKQKAAFKKNQVLADENPSIFIDKAISNAPQAMLLLLPFWALVLKLCYSFKSHFYIEHLVVALHTHAFLLCAIMIGIVFEALTTELAQLWMLPVVVDVADVIENLIMVWMVVYVVISCKVFYRQSWLVTLCKCVLCGGIYSVLILCSLSALIVLGLFST